MNLSVEAVVATAGILISVVGFYIPQYNALDSGKKQLIMLLAMLVVSLGAFGLSCTGYFNFLTCDTGGAVKAAELFALAVVSNVTTYKATNYMLTRKSR